MSVSEITAFVLALLVMLLGLVGSVVPALPGAPLIFLAALGHKLWLGERSVSWMVVVGFGLLTGALMALDYLATVYGAKKLGATWRGALGAVLGAMLGMLWLPFGLVLGPFLGAMLLEAVTGKEWREAGRAGLGATLGFLAGTIGKIAGSLAMIGLWTVMALLRLVQGP